MINNNWRDALDNRQRAEVEFCELYAQKFAHGTDGHNIRMLVYQLVLELDDLQAQVNMYTGKREVNG